MKLIEGKFEKAITYCEKTLGKEFFIFEISYVKQGERFREIDRFLYESRHTLRFKNVYSGNIVVDLSPWNKKTPNHYFDAFMYFLKDNVKLYNCIFITDEICSVELLIKLRKYFDISEIILEPNEKRNNKPKSIGFAIFDENKEETRYVRS